MGKLIVSWSPIHGQGATTSNVISLSAMMALDESYKSLITHTQMSHSTLESVYMKKDDFSFNQSGMVALERLVKSNLLTPDAVPDYTQSIYNSSLDLLPGRTNETNSEESARVRKTILQAASEHYDLLWIDAHSGTRSFTTKSLLKEADLVLVNLPQNKFVLEQFFNEDLPEELVGEKFIILISNYDEKAGLSIRNIKRTYKPSTPVFPIPYTTGFRDAMNQGSVSEFFYRAKTVEKKDSLFPFIDAIRKVNSFVFKEVGSERMEEEW